MKTCRKCVISGRVQGVFFRHATFQRAQELGLKGWVRNLYNGDVECLVCGENESVNLLCEWLKKGPPAAKVLSVTTEEVPWQDHLSFEIHR